MGHHAPGLRRRWLDARPHRRPQAGDLRLPGRRRATPISRPPRRPPREATLVVNWRSDGACSTPTTPCSPTPARPRGNRLPHRRAAPRQPASRGCSGAPGRAPLRVRVLHAADGSCPTTDRAADAGRSRGLIARDLAGDVVELLAVGGRDRRRAAGRLRAPTTLRPGALAVLVRTNRQADDGARRLLHARPCPAVIGGAGSRVRDRARPRNGCVCSTPWSGPRSRDRASLGRADHASSAGRPSTLRPPATTSGRTFTGACTAGPRCCARGRGHPARDCHRRRAPARSGARSPGRASAS